MAQGHRARGARMFVCMCVSVGMTGKGGKGFGEGWVCLFGGRRGGGCTEPQE